ncbi:MAG TPA: NAD(P)-dependent oxidoreductase [Reyranella sp.]|jgi:3-hydroxyisobutyrate dehydrogenase-like beta-hydroxyacid dehydrogenase|nr:NAD(P)-dependent oxidoreductase [Reyranella sp.]
MADLLGFVGVGRMGGPMANRLLDAGYRLCVYDVSDEATGPLVARGAELAASPAEVASMADTVFMSLPTPDVVREVALGGNGGLINGSKVRTVIDLSTTGPGVATEVAGKLAERNIAWVDSPVSGGVTGAKAGTLAVMVSCPKPAYQKLEPVLKVFGKLFHAGEKPGLAQTAKLANNLLAATAMVATSEVMAMGVKAGLDAKVLIDIINASSGRNSASQDKFPRAILPRTFDFGFATGLSYKDVRLCVEEAEAMGVPMVVGGAVREMLAVTRARFGAGSDFTYIAKVLEEWAGVEIKG